MLFKADDSPVLIKKPLKKKAKCNKNRSFHDSLKYLLFTSQFFGLFPLNGVLSADPENMNFSWCTFRTLYSLLISTSAILESVWCAYFLINKQEPFEIPQLSKYSRTQHFIFDLCGYFPLFSERLYIRRCSGSYFEFAYIESLF